MQNNWISFCFLFIYNETPFDKACSNNLINIIEYLIDIIKEKDIIYKGIYILIHQYHFETLKRRVPS